MRQSSSSTLNIDAVLLRGDDQKRRTQPVTEMILERKISSPEHNKKRKRKEYYNIDFITEFCSPDFLPTAKEKCSSSADILGDFLQSSCFWDDVLIMEQEKMKGGNPPKSTTPKNSTTL